MTFNGGTAAKRSLVSDEILTPELRNRVSSRTQVVQKAEDSRFANIEANVFYSIIFDPNLAPERKAEEITKTLTFEGTKEEMDARQEKLEVLKEYLQSVREEMHKEIIKVTDTEAFSTLKENYDQMNNALIEFDEQIKPLTDITDAIYTLRTNGVTHDVFREIKQDKEAEEALREERNAINSQLTDIGIRINNLNREIAVLEQDTGFFGGIKKSAREQIAIKRDEMSNVRAELENLQNQSNELNSRTAKTDSTLIEFAEQKAKLRELLDISGPDHKERQTALVKSALGFVETSKERIGEVRKHLAKMGTQVDSLGQASGRMQMVYATLNEGIKGAEVKNKEIRDSLAAPEGVEESLIAKMTREQKKTDLEAYITSLDSSAADTLMTFSDLVSQSTRIKTMKDATNSQDAAARNMHSQGVAGIADRLSVVLQAVSAAAVSEASAISSDTIRRMKENTDKVAQKESIRVAMGINDLNEDIMRAMDDLASYGEVTKAATQISHDGVSFMRENLAKLQEIAQGVEAAHRENIAVNADVYSGTTKKSDEAPKANKTNPFGI